MTRVEPSHSTAVPDDPVRAALENAELQTELHRHALGSLGIMLADQAHDRRRELAEEILQDVRRRAWEKRATFDPSLGKSVAGWIHGILNKVLLESCRTLRKQPIQPPTDTADWESLGARLASDTAADLAELLCCLPEEQRQLVAWHHLDGLSHREIAERVGVSEAAARVQLCRAMKALKQIAAGKEVVR